MPKGALIFAAILSLLLLLVLGFLQFRQTSQARTEAENAAAAAQRQAEQAGITNGALATELESLRAHTVELEQQVQQAQQARQARDSMEQQMRAELDSKDITISQLQGKLTVNILDRVLFDSGQASLKPEGQAVLVKVAQVLARFPNRAVQVIGHTDNVPIRARTPDGFTDNWALSAGRAVTAVRFLVERTGADPKRLSAAGCGEFKPIADNATPEGRAKNRRIAVVVLPEEIVLGDVVKPVVNGAAAPAPISPPAP
ncbi:MAG TPA: OmpA family protein [Candidatus Limnocylindria bacterium]|jgi:chemotaxis protein MotB|nr:OmpA family protein [Candidatus Limnocylindria bacterium]